MKFKEWLITKKKFTERSASDVVSRYNRATNILGYNALDYDSLALIEDKDKFKILSCGVKSQIRRSIRLYIEFKQEES